MTLLEFSNGVDGLTNDFVTGVSDELEFKSEILDLLINVASPHLEKKPETDPLLLTPEFKFIESSFVPSDNIKGEFFTLTVLESLFIDNYPNQEVHPRRYVIPRALQRLKCKRTAYRLPPYNNPPVYGYWLERLPA